MSEATDTKTAEPVTTGDNTIGAGSVSDILAADPNSAALISAGDDTIPATDPAHDITGIWTLEDRVSILEEAVRVLATSLYAPNGGGAEHVTQAEALFAYLTRVASPPADDPDSPPAEA